jgi:hypothetical protein
LPWTRGICNVLSDPICDCALIRRLLAIVLACFIF